MTDRGEHEGESYWVAWLPELIKNRLEGRVRLQSIIANTGWLAFDRIFRMGVGLVVGVWIARYLGPELYGVLNYAIAFVGLFGSLCVLGLDSIIIRDIVRDPSCKDETLGTAFLLKLGGAFVALTLALAIILSLGMGDRTTHLLVAIIAAGMLFQAFDVIDMWFQSQVQSKFTVYARNTAFIVLSVAKIVMILLEAPLSAFAAAGSAEVALGAMGLVIMYRKNGNAIRDWRASTVRARSLLQNSWPLILSDLAIFVQARIDQVMLGQMLGNKEVGLYAAASRMAEVFNFIPMIICSSVYPLIVESKRDNVGLYSRRMTNLYRFMMITTLAVGIPVSLLSEPVTHLFYGEAYGGVGLLLSLLIWTRVFTNFGVAKSLFISTENLFKYALVCAVSGTIVNICANYVLIPIYGIVGSIIATNISFTITIFAIDAIYPRTRQNFLLMMKGIFTFYRISR